MAFVPKENLLKRKADVARLALFGGLTQLEIGSKLGIDQSTVSKHLKAIRAEWRASAQRDIEDIISQELKKLDALEIDALTGWDRSKKAVKKKTTAKKTLPEGVVEESEKNETFGQVGDPRFLTVLISIQERRAKLLGTDKPAKIAPTDPTGAAPYESLSDQEIAARISELSQKLGVHGAG